MRRKISNKAEQMLTLTEWKQLDSNSRLAHIERYDGEFRLTGHQVQARRLLKGILDNELLDLCPAYGKAFFEIFRGCDLSDSIRRMHNSYTHNKLYLVNTLIQDVSDAPSDAVRRVFNQEKCLVLDYLTNINLVGTR